eukprot:5956388-Lingulodinium_polyedra.AAC.1
MILRKSAWRGLAGSSKTLLTTLSTNGLSSACPGTYELENANAPSVVHPASVTFFASASVSPTARRRLVKYASESRAMASDLPRVAWWV